jgi:hypothetical protein
VSLGAGDGSGPRVVELTGRAATWAERAGFTRLVGSSCDDGDVAFAVVFSERA